MKREITITISGVAGSGKSTLARHVIETLGAAGFAVAIDDPDSPFVFDRDRMFQDKCLLALQAKQVRGELAITVKTHQLPVDQMTK